MILKKSEKPNKTIEIDLTGPDGNAFVLLGTAANLSKQIWRETLSEREDRRRDNEIRKLIDIPEVDEGEMTRRILSEMRESDYEHLVNTFDKYFGDFVILYR